MLLADYSGPQKAVLSFRGWAGRYLKGLPGAKNVRQAVYRAREAEEILELLKAYFLGLSRSGELAGGKE